MLIRRTLRAVIVSALVVAGALAGNATAFAATQNFLGHAVDFGPTAALLRAQEHANTQAAAAGYNPSTQCTVVGNYAREISNNGAWEAWVTIRCVNES